MRKTNTVLVLAILLICPRALAQIADPEGDADIPCIDITSLDVRSDRTHLTALLQTSLRPYPPDHVIDGIDDPNTVRLCPHSSYQLSLDIDDDGHADHVLETRFDEQGNDHTSGPPSLEAEIDLKAGWIRWKVANEDLGVQELPAVVRIACAASITPERVTVVPLRPVDTEDEALGGWQGFLIGAAGSALIGPSGGTLEVTDPDSALFGTSLAVPEGALEEPVSISCDRAILEPEEEPTPLNTPIVNFQPNGLVFAVPASVNLPLIAPVAETSIPLLATRSEQGIEWAYSPATRESVDELYGSLTHFSLVAGCEIEKSALDVSVLARDATKFSWHNDVPNMNNENWCGADGDNGCCGTLVWWAYWYSVLHPRVRGEHEVIGKDGRGHGLRFAYPFGDEIKPLVQDIDVAVDLLWDGLPWFPYTRSPMGLMQAAALVKQLRDEERPVPISILGAGGKHMMLVYEWIVPDDGYPYFNVYDPNDFHTPERLSLRYGALLFDNPEWSLKYPLMTTKDWKSDWEPTLQQIFEEYSDMWTYYEMPEIERANCTEGTMTVQFSPPRRMSYEEFPNGEPGFRPRAYVLYVAGDVLSGAYPIRSDADQESDDFTEQEARELPNGNLEYTFATNYTSAEFPNVWTTLGVYNELKPMQFSWYPEVANEHDSGWDPPQGLIAHWPLDGDGRDVSGNGHDGIVRGAVAAEDRFGNDASALAFDGNDVVEIRPSLQLRSVSFTAWAKGRVFDGGFTKSYEIVTVNDEGTHLSLDVHEQGDCGTGGGESSPRWEWGQGDTIPVPCSDEIAEGAWHFIVGTYDETTGQKYLYVDGERKAESSIGQFSVEADLITIGGPTGFQGSARGWRGTIDDVRLYDEALTASQVRELYSGSSQ